MEISFNLYITCYKIGHCTCMVIWLKNVHAITRLDSFFQKAEWEHLSNLQHVIVIFTILGPVKLQEIPVIGHGLLVSFYNRVVVI